VVTKSVAPPQAAHPANQGLVDLLASWEPIDEEVGPIEDLPPEPVTCFDDWTDDDDVIGLAEHRSSAAEVTIARDDPTRADVAALIALHTREAQASTPRENAHALDAAALAGARVSFFTARDADGALAGMAALAEVAPRHVEVKSMRTAPDQLRRGVARALLAHLLAEARVRGATRVSLETGTAPMFDAANRLYEAAGFVDGPAFGGYPESAHNRFMTMAL
jgi:putative acetyltransferase